MGAARIETLLGGEKRVWCVSKGKWVNGAKCSLRWRIFVDVVMLLLVAQACGRFAIGEIEEWHICS